MSSVRPTIDQLAAIKRAVEIVGGQSAMARLLGRAQASVWAWVNKGTPVPAEHCFAIEDATGVSRHDLRPDIYPRDDAPTDVRGDHLQGVRP